MIRAHLIAGGLLVTLALALPSPVGAQTLDPSALTAEQRSEIGDLFTRARKAYEAGNFLEAIELLERAHGIFPEPNILYRIGDAYESAGELEQAVAAYRKYLAAAPDASDRGIVSRRVEDLERRIEAANPEEPPPPRTTLVLDSKPLGAAIEVDGQATGASTPARLPLEPGAHRIVLRAEGFEPLERDFKVEAGETLSLVYELDALPEPQQPPAWPWVFGGVGLAGVGASATLFVVSMNASRRVDAWDDERDAAFDAGESPPPRPPAYDETVRRSVAMRRGAFVALGVGAASLGVGAIWLAVGSTPVALVPGPSSVGLVARF